MALVLDTDALPARERAEAVDAAMRVAGVPARVTHQDSHGDVHARIELFPLGAGTTLMHRRGSGVRLTRTAGQVRVAAPERAALTVMTDGRWSYAQGGHERVSVDPGPGMVLTDHAAPYDFDRPLGGETHSLGFDHDALGVPVDVLRAAVGRIEGSPLYDLVRGQLLAVAQVLPALPAGPAATMLGNSLTELVRALVTTSAGPAAAGRGALADTLHLRITLYLQDHLREPDLTPARIARAHHISVRQLYSVWSRGSELSLAEWIMAERLESARRELVRPAARAYTIAAVARRAGFADAAHFARRFRSAYGLSPREWRRAHRS